jgi:conjugal transfer ATP-binding protein TraC
MDNFTDALLRSLKRNGTEYSDLLIRGPDTQTVCRLVLDPFSGTLYSSSPPSMPGSRPRSRGATMAEAIECVAYGLDRKAKGARP